MVKKRGRPSKKELKEVKEKKPNFYSTYKKYIWAGFLMILTLIFLFAFIGSAGTIGNNIEDFFYFLLGNSIFIFPFIFIMGTILLLLKNNPYEEKENYVLGLSFALIVEISVLWSIAELYKLGFPSFDWSFSGKGGWIGYMISYPILSGFGFWVTFLVFIVLTSLTLIILLDPFLKKRKENMEKEELVEESKEIILEKKEVKKSIIPKIIIPKVSINKKEIIKTEEKREGKQRKVYSEYKAPPLSILAKINAKPESGDIKEKSDTIKRTLHNFGIPVVMDEVSVGPTVSQYTLKPAEGVKLSKITNLSTNLALDLATPSIRIEAPIPGRSLVGIEIPNKKRVSVGLREMLEAKEFTSSTAPLLFTLGKDVRGEAVYADLADMPHLLVAGTTGSGKSIALNCIILSLLYRNSPEDMQLVLVDPKKVEFPVYDPAPHMMAPVLSSGDDAVIALKWLVGEMERRLEILKMAGNRDISTYNKAWKDGMEKMPYIVVIIDELADLMMARGKELESYVVRIAQKARAVGIHLILATQRPSVEVITGLIKANISSRLGLKVASQIDSRTMLDQGGAEKLLGKGDLLFQSKESSNLKRIQCPFVSEKEIKDVITWISENQIKSLDDIADGYLEIEENDNSLRSVLEEAQSSPDVQINQFLQDEDPLFGQARQLVIQTQKASTSFLQRKLGVGYARAARLMDTLEEAGIVSAQEGSRQRDVLVKEE